MLLRRLFLFLSILQIVSCSPVTPAATLPLINVYSTAAAQPWLDPLYACAESVAVVSRSADASTADLVLRVGEPEFLTTPAYQIDMEEILIVTHSQSPVRTLSLEEARALFAGQGDPSLQMWVYADGEDLQEVFRRVVMEGSRITPSAWIAFTPQYMAETLASEPNTVGLLSRRWMDAGIQEVLSVGTVPVLAITPSEPQETVKDLIACLQR
jgi:hypothetical protein